MNELRKMGKKKSPTHNLVGFIKTSALETKTNQGCLLFNFEKLKELHLASLAKQIYFLVCKV